MSNSRTLTLRYCDVATFPKNTGYKLGQMWRMYAIGRLKKAGFATVPLAEATDENDILSGRWEARRDEARGTITFMQWPALAPTPDTR